MRQPIDRQVVHHPQASAALVVGTVIGLTLNHEYGVHSDDTAE